MHVDTRSLPRNPLHPRRRNLRHHRLPRRLP